MFMWSYSNTSTAPLRRPWSTLYPKLPSLLARGSPIQPTRKSNTIKDNVDRGINFIEASDVDAKSCEPTDIGTDETIEHKYEDTRTRSCV